MMKLVVSQLGVSIMEVMIVVVIIAISAALTIPMMVNHTERNRLKLSGETFYNDAVRARSEALRTNAAVNIIFQTGANWCYGLTTEVTCDCGVVGSCALGEVQPTKYRGSVTNMSATGIVGSVQFEGDRGMVTPPGTINFTSASGETISIVLIGMGSAQVCSSDLGGYDPC